MVKHKCKQCKNYFIGYKYLKNKYCSRKCFTESITKNTLKKYCLYCGKGFNRKRWNNGVLEFNFHFFMRSFCCRSHSVKHRWKNENYRKKIILAISGNMKNQWKNGKRISSMKGKSHSIITRRKMRAVHKKLRTKNHFWKGGILILHESIRKSLECRIWRESIFKRDNYTCQECFHRGKKLNAHHKNKSFSQLLAEFLNQYSQFSPIEDKETLARLAITYSPFWDINNGITLCKDCHRETDNYGMSKRWSRVKKIK